MANTKQVKDRFELYSPTLMPQASSFLWNKKMMLHMNCRGFASAQHMQPEPGKYAYAPCLEAKTFMQPEQPYYAHHPGRFFYLKDEDSGELWSLPYEPVRHACDAFTFSCGTADIRWLVQVGDIVAKVQVSLPVDDALELWTLSIENTGSDVRRLSIYPFFPIGYMSWMNQSASYNETLGGIVASCITPYQKLEDYPKIKTLKDKTFFLHDVKPCAWEANLKHFEGEGGLHNPTALTQLNLMNGDALYETPAAVFQYRETLQARALKTFRFIFGPARDDEEIRDLRARYLDSSFTNTEQKYQQYLSQGKACLQISTPDKALDDFVNHWLPRQMYYHGDVNRLSTDPQTRNYLQDNMGMSYIAPQTFRQALLHALQQQASTGAMPDGILLHPDAELKYVNQIPHTDHCVWLPVCLKAYLDETNDYAIFKEMITNKESREQTNVFECIDAAMQWLIKARDDRQLSFIAQGDWCDPMNMVGPEGCGVSIWLTQASAYAFSLWAQMCREINEVEIAQQYSVEVEILNSALNQHAWDGRWYTRGISDNGTVFGKSTDSEGRIFLNPQSWAILAGCADAQKLASIKAAVEETLDTPYGPAMLAPPFTKMHEHIGRVTQKFPGSAENGSVYNHAAIFYIFSLYHCGEKDSAYRYLRQMIPGPDPQDMLQRGQLPVFIPNYYRGAYALYPRTAGRSSQLFNTGTVSWYYRCLVEGLFGVCGCPEGLRISPQLPDDWQTAKIERRFRAANFSLEYRRKPDAHQTEIALDGKAIEGCVIKNIEAGRHYRVEVVLPSLP